MSRLDTVTIIGSLRRDSYTARIVKAMQPMAPDSMVLDIVSLKALTLYNEDEDGASPPVPWVEFRERVKRADAVLFATPEYNRSVPGVLKNAIDIGSRPAGKSIWSGKPAAILSASPGALGAFGANHHLRQSLVFLDMPTLQQPECYVSGADRVLDHQGSFAHSSTQDFLRRFLERFAAWIQQTAPLRTDAPAVH
jgi:chromate reductase, NAD(P)H dehydrogenase (quinone)